MDRGKELEDKFEKWCKELDIYYKRLYDARSGVSGGSQPADFYIYLDKRLIYIECKHTNAQRISFSGIRPSQYKAAMKAFKYNIEYYLIIEFDDDIRLLNMKYFIEIAKMSDSKSFPCSGIKLEKSADFKSFLTPL